jgi:hypothetical protein
MRAPRVCLRRISRPDPYRMFLLEGIYDVDFKVIHDDGRNAGILIPSTVTGEKSIEDTITKLVEVSENAQQRAPRVAMKGYARITVENAAAAVARNWGRNRA